MTDTPPFLTVDGVQIQRWFDVPSQADWHKVATKMLKGRDPATLTQELPEGVTREALFHGDASVAGGVPDAPPYVRGSRAADRRAAGWDVRAKVQGASVLAAADAALADVHRGARSLWILPDESGVATLADLGTLLRQLDLSATPLHIEAGAASAVWLHALRAVADDKGTARAGLTGTLACDPPGALARDGVVSGSIASAYDDLAATIRDATDSPWLQLWACSGLPYADAGAHGVQELACVLAAGAEGLRQLGVRGLTIADVAPRALLQLSIGSDTFVEIARLRALRGLWSQLIALCGGDAEAQRSFVHAVSARSVLTRRDPWVNTLRATGAGFSAAVAGADAVTLRAWDEPLGVPEESARRLSCTGQVVLEAEAHLARVGDPAGGSWYIEAMTDRFARAAWQAFQEIEGRGGLVAALRSGWLDGWITTARAARLAEVVASTRPVLGVSVHPNAEEELPMRAAPTRPVHHGQVAAGVDAASWTRSLRAGDLLTGEPDGERIVALAPYTDEGAWEAGQEVAQ